MNWESYVLMYHAYKVNQPGNITRIVSGCNVHEQQSLQEFHQQYIVPHFGERFNIHFTPNYSRIQLASGDSYKYMNKPYGLRHWLRHGLMRIPSNNNNNNNNHSPTIHTIPPSELASTAFMSDSIEQSIVLLVDPDFVLLRPLKHDHRYDPYTLWVENPPPPIQRRVVYTGHPMALQDGYLSSDWRTLDFANITELSHGLYQPPPSASEGVVHWNVRLFLGQ
jgi:peptidyl serine alpha-galactosyltransferase